MTFSADLLLSDIKSLNIYKYAHRVNVLEYTHIYILTHFECIHTCTLYICYIYIYSYMYDFVLIKQVFITDHKRAHISGSPCILISSEAL